MTDPYSILVIKIDDSTVTGPDGPLSAAAIKKLADFLFTVAARQAYMELRRRYPLGSQVVVSPHGPIYEVVGYGVPGTLSLKVRVRPVGSQGPGRMLPANAIEPVPDHWGGEHMAWGKKGDRDSSKSRVKCDACCGVNGPGITTGGQKPGKNSMRWAHCVACNGSGWI